MKKAGIIVSICLIIVCVIIVNINNKVEKNEKEPKQSKPSTVEVTPTPISVEPTPEVAVLPTQSTPKEEVKPVQPQTEVVASTPVEVTSDTVQTAAVGELYVVENSKEGIEKEEIGRVVGKETRVCIVGETKMLLTAVKIETSSKIPLELYLSEQVEQSLSLGDELGVRYREIENKKGMKIYKVITVNQVD